MCDEREQLIGYIYGESDAAERGRVEAHLAECHVCRAEVGALRHVREDLLAWDVPRHESIWRPVAPVAPRPTWRQIPSWALAAAATLVFAAGAGGGMAVRMLAPQMVTAVAGTESTQAPAAAGVAAVTLTPDDLARLEADILARVRAEVDTRLQTAAATGTASPQLRQAGTRPLSAEFQAFSDRLAEVERWKDDQIRLNVMFDSDLGRLNNRTSNLHSLVERSGLQQVGFVSDGR